MSRGPGRIQNAILSYLVQHGSTTFESMRWDLWIATLKAPFAASRDLPNKWNTSVFRAVRALQEVGRVKLESRRLHSFEECVPHYPNKTLRGSLRQLRLGLLPALLNWIHTGDAFPRYNSAENERFHLESLSSETRSRLGRAWARVEPELVGLLPDTTGKKRNALFELIAKAKSVFELESLECRFSFTDCAHRCAELHFMSESLSKGGIAVIR